MAINQRHLVEMLVEECEGSDELFPGYRESLVQTLAEILSLESQHRRSGIDIAKKTRDQVEALGQLILKNG